MLDGGFPEASFQATLNACAKRLPTPVMYLEAALGHKKAVKQRIEDDRRGCSPRGATAWELRAVKVRGERGGAGREVRDPDEHAGAGSVGDPPPVRGRDGERGGRREDLCWWESQGKKLEGRAVAVEARRVADRVIAIVQPVEERRDTRQQSRETLFSE